MSLEYKSEATWEDIQELYTALNTARKKFSFNQIILPENPGEMVPEHITNLNTLVNSMSSNRYLTRVAVTGITPPTSGQLIKAEPYTTISNTIARIQRTCAFDSYRSFSDCSDCNNRSFGFDSSDGGCTSFTYNGHNGF